MASTTAEENYNTGTGVLAIAWAFTTAAVIVMALRVVAKIKINHFNIDDVAMIIALVFLLASTACITLSVQVGLTRNAVVTHAQEVACLKWYMIAQALLIVSSMIGRVAFIMYLRRLIPVQSKTRAVLFVLLALQPCVNVVPILLMFLQCKEFAAVFDHTITNVHCLPVVIQINFGFFQGAFNTATDLYLATFPIYSFWGLQLRLRIKVVLICLLSMGLFAMIGSLIKTIELRSIGQPGDPIVTESTLLHWAYIEAGLVVITSSIPCLRPLFVAMSKDFSTSLRPTYELGSHGYRQSSGHTRSHITSRTHAFIRSDPDDGWGDGDSARKILGETRGGLTKETTVTVRNEEL